MDHYHRKQQTHIDEIVEKGIRVRVRPMLYGEIHLMDGQGKFTWWTRRVENGQTCGMIHVDNTLASRVRNQG